MSSYFSASLPLPKCHTRSTMRQRNSPFVSLWSADVGTAKGSTNKSAALLPACRVTRTFAQLMAATPNAPVTNAVGAQMAHNTCYRAIVTLVYSPRQQQRSLNAPVTTAIGQHVLLPARSFHQTLPAKTIKSPAEPVTTGLIARQAPRERRALVTGLTGNSNISPVASRHVNCAGNKRTR